MQLADKVVVITGAGRGIGRALAQRFAREQAKVALLDLNEADLQETERLCHAEGVAARSYACNVASEEQVSALTERIFAAITALIPPRYHASYTGDGPLAREDGRDHPGE